MNQPSNPVPPFEIVRAVYLYRVNRALKWALDEFRYAEDTAPHFKESVPAYIKRVASTIRYCEKGALEDIKRYQAEFLAYAQGKKSFDELAHVARSQVQSFVELQALIKQGEGK